MYRLAGTKMPQEAEVIEQSSQTEQEISQIVEKARRRRQQQQERRKSRKEGVAKLDSQRSGDPARSRRSGELSNSDSRSTRNHIDAVPTGLAPLDEAGIAEVARNR